MQNRNKSELSKILGIPKTTTTIASIIKQFEENGSLENRRGRRRLLTARYKTKLSRVLIQGRRQSLSDATNFMNEGKDQTFCQKTIERKKSFPWLQTEGCKEEGGR